MSKTSPLFAWRDRDTAARLMLQLSQIAPPYVRRRALSILHAFKSDVVIDEMVEIIMDDRSYNHYERIAALETLTAVPSGKLHLPQLAPFVLDEWDEIPPTCFIRFAAAHPANADWVFARAKEVLHRDDYLQELSYLALTWGNHPILRRYVEPDLEAIIRVNTHMKTDLQEIAEEQARIAKLWDNAKSEEEVEEIFSDHPILMELYQHYQAALNGEEESFYELSHVPLPNGMSNYSSVEQAAAATHLLGRLAHRYDVIEDLWQILRDAPSPDEESDRRNSGVRFYRGDYIAIEAGSALSRIVKPQTWEALIDIFFMGVQSDYDAYMFRWIERLTDKLSTQPIE